MFDVTSATAVAEFRFCRNFLVTKYKGKYGIKSKFNLISNGGGGGKKK
jgi:hypothetical protein